MVRRAFLTIGLACAFVPAGAQAEADRLIVAGERVGPIDAAASEKTLEALLPAGQVRRVLFHIGEDFHICGSEVFAGTADAVFVTWANGPAEYDGAGEAALERCRGEPPMERPASVTIQRPAGGEAQGWATADGIRVGMSFLELARVAGAPLSASVCPCDYGGFVFGGQQGMDPHLTLRIIFPVDVEALLGPHIDVDNDFALLSSAIPAAMEAEFLVDRIEVVIGPR